MTSQRTDAATILGFLESLGCGAVVANPAATARLLRDDGRVRDALLYGVILPDICDAETMSELVAARPSPAVMGRVTARFRGAFLSRIRPDLDRLAGAVSLLESIADAAGRARLKVGRAQAVSAEAYLLWWMGDDRRAMSAAADAIQSGGGAGTTGRIVASAIDRDIHPAWIGNGIR